MRLKIIDTGWKFMLWFVVWAACGHLANGQRRPESRPEQSPEYMHKNVSVPTERMRVDSLARLITRQTGIRFSLNTKKFDLSRIIRIKKGQQSIGELLTAIKANAGISCLLMGDHIIFVDTPPAKKTVYPGKRPTGNAASGKTQPGNASPKKTSPRNIPTANASSAKTLSRNASPQKPDVKNQSAGSQQKNDPEPAEKAIATATGSDQATAATKDTTRKKTTDTIQVSKQPAGNPLANNHPSTTQPTITQLLAKQPLAKPVTHTSRPSSSRPSTPSSASTPATEKKETGAWSGEPFLQAGLTMDDLFYLQTRVTGGYPWLYGIVSWGTNFSVSAILYGAGTSLRLSDSWRLHLAFTTGSSSKDFQADSVKERETLRIETAGILFEKNWGGRFRLQGGPSFNDVITKYYLDGAASSFVMNESETESKFHVFHPVYTISNSYSPSSAKNTKLSIGFQVSLFYRLNL